MRPAKSFLAFAGAGAAGFLIEAVILTGLTLAAGWNAVHARAVSFPLAATVTWLLNRRFAFAGRGVTRLRTEYAGYLAIQIAGACVNLAIFVICITAFPRLAAWPFVPLAAGAAFALVFNFVLARTILYSRALGTRARAPDVP